MGTQAVPGYGGPSGAISARIVLSPVTPRLCSQEEERQARGFVRGWMWTDSVWSSLAWEDIRAQAGEQAPWVKTVASTPDDLNCVL